MILFLKFDRNFITKQSQNFSKYHGPFAVAYSTQFSYRIIAETFFEPYQAPNDFAS